MKDSGALKVTARSDREIVMTRVFDAPRNLVFDAYTKPELLKRWLGVFGGYSMPVCACSAVLAPGPSGTPWRSSPSRSHAPGRAADSLTCRCAGKK